MWECVLGLGPLDLLDARVVPANVGQVNVADVLVVRTDWNLQLATVHVRHVDSEAGEQHAVHQRQLEPVDHIQEAPHAAWTQASRAARGPLDQSPAQGGGGGQGATV